MPDYFADDLDMENGMVDSPIVRAHTSAAELQKNGGPAEQTLGRSRGGFSTNIHVTTDAPGYPLRLYLTSGQRHDIIKAHDLTIDLDFDSLLADRSYGAQDFVEELLAKGIEVVIPPNNNARAAREYDVWCYRQN